MTEEPLFQPDCRMVKKRLPIQWDLTVGGRKRSQETSGKFGIPYMTNPHDIQVMTWAKDRRDLGEVIHVWGSLPRAPWCSLQHLNQHVVGETFQEDLEERRHES